jgi:hypothetical protein
MLTVLTFLLAGVNPGQQLAAACLEQPVPQVEIAVERGAVKESSTMSLDDIRKLHEANGAPSPHKPLGFYLSTFSYRIEVDDPYPAHCAGQVRVRISMVLDSRQIVLGREVVANRSVRIKSLVSDQGTIKSLQEAGAALSNIERVLKPVLEGELPGFEAKNRELQSNVDSSAALQKLEDACSTPI